jgi:hypothetical protein
MYEAGGHQYLVFAVTSDRGTQENPDRRQPRGYVAFALPE